MLILGNKHNADEKVVNEGILFLCNLIGGM